MNLTLKVRPHPYATEAHPRCLIDLEVLSTDGRNRYLARRIVDFTWPTFTMTPADEVLSNVTALERLLSPGGGCLYCNGNGQVQVKGPKGTIAATYTYLVPCPSCRPTRVPATIVDPSR